MDPDHQLEASRRTFGRFLRNWRKSNGWVITTPQDWARACPAIIPPGYRVSSGQWANLENAKVLQAQPSTFLQLQLLNLALCRDHRGAIHDDLLRERVTSGRPVLHPDGSPWRAEDWFACFIGHLQGPQPLWPAEQDPTELLRERFTALVERHQLRPVTALVQLLSLAGGLTTAQQLAIEGALLQGEPLNAVELEAADQLLKQWRAILSQTGS